MTSALDVSVQAAVLKLLQDLKNELGTTYIFVSHDLAVVRAISDRVAVLYQGRLCEIGPSSEVYQYPSHPYTDLLISSVPELRVGWLEEADKNIQEAKNKLEQGNLT